MQIAFVEIQNFRKLKSVRVDLDDRTTLLVGANNSGKTSAMVALRHFLVSRGEFSTNDVHLSNWSKINAVGDAWVQSDDPDLRRALEAPVAPAQGMIAGQRETPSESLPGAFWSLLHSVSVPGETPDTEAH